MKVRNGSKEFFIIIIIIIRNSGNGHYDNSGGRSRCGAALTGEGRGGGAFRCRAAQEGVFQA